MKHPLLCQPGFWEELTVSNYKETLRTAKGEEKLPVALLLMSHFWRTAPARSKPCLQLPPVPCPSAEQALHAVPSCSLPQRGASLACSSLPIPEAAAASPSLCHPPSPAHFILARGKEAGSYRNTRPLEESSGTPWEPRGRAQEQPCKGNPGMGSSRSKAPSCWSQAAWNTEWYMILPFPSSISNSKGPVCGAR